VAVDEPGQRVDRIPDTSHGRQRCAGVGKHGSASLGDPYGPGRAVQQGLPEFSLQSADLRAHPGLRDVRFGGSLGEARLFRHRDEVLQLPQLHNKSC
jgi:hypothetical protein